MDTFSIVAPPTQLNTIAERFSPSLAFEVTFASSISPGLVVTLPWMLENVTLRSTAGVVDSPSCACIMSSFTAGGGVPGGGRRGGRGPTPTWIGPVTSSSTMLENDRFSYVDPGFP